MIPVLRRINIFGWKPFWNHPYLQILFECMILSGFNLGMPGIVSLFATKTNINNNEASRAVIGLILISISTILYGLLHTEVCIGDWHPENTYPDCGWRITYSVIGFWIGLWSFLADGIIPADDFSTMILKFLIVLPFYLIPYCFLVIASELDGEGASYNYGTLWEYWMSRMLVMWQRSYSSLEELIEMIKNYKDVHLDIPIANLHYRLIRAVKKGLEHHSNVKSLGLKLNFSCDKDVKEFGEMLEKNKTLRKLNITSYYGFDFNRFAQALELIEENTTLKSLSLDIDGSNIDPSDEEARVITRMLSQNRGIVSISLSGRIVGKGSKLANEIELNWIHGKSGSDRVEINCSDSTKLTSVIITADSSASTKEEPKLIYGKSGSDAFYSLIINNALVKIWYFREELVRQLSTQTCLDLESTNIGDKGVKELAQMLLGNNILRTLNLEDNRIHDEGAKKLALVLLQNTTLTTLNLERNDISTEGVVELTRILQHNTTLKHLIINDSVHRHEDTDDEKVSVTW